MASLVPEVLDGRRDDPREVLVVPYAAAPQWDMAARTWPDGVRLLSVGAESAARLNDKVFIRQLCDSLGVESRRLTEVVGQGLRANPRNF